MIEHDLRTGRADTLNFDALGLDVDRPVTNGDRLAWMQTADDTSIDGSTIVLTSGAYPSGTPVTNSDAWNRFPRLSSRLLVWERRAGTMDRAADVVVRDLATGDQDPITAGEGWNIQPRVDGGRVVWTQVETGKDGDATAYRVILFDVATGEIRILSEDGRPNGSPDVSGSVVTWVVPGGDLVYRDFEDDGVGITGRIPTDASFPSISFPWIVWEKHEADDNVDIWTHNLETGETISVTRDPIRQSFPQVSSNRVVWSELGQHGWRVMMARLE